MTIEQATFVDPASRSKIQQTQTKSLETMSQAERDHFNATSETALQDFYALGDVVGSNGLPTYALQVSKKNGGTVEIVNTDSGKTLNVWGDPHTNINGKSFADIYEDTTIILEDGTKVSLHVVPGEHDPSTFYVQDVTITSADNKFGIQAKNLHSGGDITVNEYRGEQDVKALDSSAEDGDWWQVTDGGSKLQESFTAIFSSDDWKSMTAAEFFNAITSQLVVNPGDGDSPLMNWFKEYNNNRGGGQAT
jgi:hypothetical protein